MWRIADWSEVFESSESRRTRRLSWVRIPTTRGTAYVELMASKEGPAHYGVFVALVGLAANCEERGTLARDGEPIALATLARMLHVSSTQLERSATALLQIGWLKELAPAPSRRPADPQQTPSRSPENTHDREEERREEKKLPCVAEATRQSPERVVFEHYQRKHPRAKWTDKVRKLIKARLAEGWTVGELTRAIDGNHADPWCNGSDPRNESGKKYHGLGLILRDAEHVDQYIGVTGPDSSDRLAQIQSMRKRRNQQ